MQRSASFLMDMSFVAYTENMWLFISVCQRPASWGPLPLQRVQAGGGAVFVNTQPVDEG
jgi:hypothetical protein